MTYINWDDLLNTAKEASFQVLPASDYHIRVEEPQAVTSSTAKPMVKFRCRVQSGPHQRASILTQQVLTIDNPQAVAIFIRFLNSFGINEQILRQLGTTQDLTPIAQMLDGREAIAVVSIRQWQGEDRNQVDRFKPIGAGAPSGTGGPVGLPTTGVPGGQPPGIPTIPVPGAQMPQPTPNYGTPSLPTAPAPAAAVQDTPTQPLPMPVSPSQQAAQAAQVAQPAPPVVPPAPVAPQAQPAPVVPPAPPTPPVAAPPAAPVAQPTPAPEPTQPAPAQANGLNLPPEVLAALTPEQIAALTANSQAAQAAPAPAAPAPQPAAPAPAEPQVAEPQLPY